MNKDIEDCKHWLNAVSCQLDRIRISFSDHLTLVQNNDKKKSSITSPYLTEYSRTSSQLWADIHFLYVALNHLRKICQTKTIRRTITNFSFDKETEEISKHLRNIFEHWDHTRATFERNLVKKDSAKWFFDKDPLKTPWSISLDAKGFIISGVLDVNQLQYMVNKLENYFIESKM